MPTYAVIWIDNQESRIFHVDPAATTDTLLLTLQHQIERQPNASARAPEQPYRMHRFFADVARVLDGVDGILLVGPASTKLEFFRYVYQHERRLEQRVVGIETADHPADVRMIAGARIYFGVTDPAAAARVV